MADYSLFKSKVQWVTDKLLDDFPQLSSLDAFAILGNIGHECGGFRLMQEQKPTVAGSRGGFGWCQWTGPRRRSYEAYCKRNNLDPTSDAANYAYLFLELKGLEGTEGAAVAKTAAAKGLEAKVIAFEKSFLRAGVKHYDSRILYAKLAQATYKDNDDEPVLSSGSGSGSDHPSEVPVTVPVIVEVEKPAPSMNKYNKAVGAFIGAVIPLIVLAIPDVANVVGAPYDQLLIAIGGILGTFAASANAKK